MVENGALPSSYRGVVTAPHVLFIYWKLCAIFLIAALGWIVGELR